METKLTTRRVGTGFHRVIRGGQNTVYSLRRGGYYGTTDDRADRWYIDSGDYDYLDRRGPGFRTIAEALNHLQEASR